jgi:hypothetical protein
MTIFAAAMASNSLRQDRSMIEDAVYINAESLGMKSLLRDQSQLLSSPVEVTDMRFVVPVSESLNDAQRISSMGDHEACAADTLNSSDNAQCEFPATIHFHINIIPSRKRLGYRPKHDAPHAQSTIPEEHWERIRPVLRRLYLDEGKSLAQVMDIMRLVYGFKARRVYGPFRHSVL